MTSKKVTKALNKFYKEYISEFKRIIKPTSKMGIVEIEEEKLNDLIERFEDSEKATIHWMGVAADKMDYIEYLKGEKND